MIMNGRKSKVNKAFPVFKSILKFNFRREVAIRTKHVMSFSNNVKHVDSFVKIHGLLLNNRKMNWLIGHPKQLIHLVCFVNMSHFSSLKTVSTWSSYILAECVSLEGKLVILFCFVFCLFVLTESVWYI